MARPNGGGDPLGTREMQVQLLPPDDTDDYQDMVGTLGSSCIEFWGKQHFQNKGYSVERYQDRYQRSSSILRLAPLPDSDQEPRTALASALDATATTRAACLPAAVLASDSWPASALGHHLEDASARYRHLTHRMVALQEELDWLSYRAFGLLLGHDTLAPEAIEPIAPGHRPFEIVLARDNAASEPEEQSEWFRAHGHDETTTIPDHYSQATRDRITERLRIIASNAEIRLIEQPQFKRRFQLPDMDAETKTAATGWLLDRLEDLFVPAEEGRPAGALSLPRPCRLEELVQAWTTGPEGVRVVAVAQVLVGTADVDLAALAEKLLRDNAVPDNPYRVYTAEGLRKLRRWQEVWAHQDREDAGEKVNIPEPSDFDRDDFTQARYFQIRGKLNVPRERFVLFADVRPEAWGWNGWRDRARAMAQVEAYNLVEGHPTDPYPTPTAADPRRCGATLGLWERLPDLRRWGDPATKDAEYGELLSFAQSACNQRQCPCDIVDAWTTFDKRKLPVVREAAPAPEAQSATIEERARLVQSMLLFGAGGATRAELGKGWLGEPARLDLVIDDLIASGDVSAAGRGKRRMFSLHKSLLTAEQSARKTNADP